MSSADEIPPAPRNEVARVELEPHQDDRHHDAILPDELRSLISVERARIDSQNRRTDLGRLIVEKNDQADERQFGVRMAQIEAQKEESRSRHKFARQVFFCAGISGLAVLALLLWLTFWGTPGQSSLAISAMKTLASAVGGYGVFSVASRIARPFMGNSRRTDTH